MDTVEHNRGMEIEISSGFVSGTLRHCQNGYRMTRDDDSAVKLRFLASTIGGDSSGRLGNGGTQVE
jgi:hypothetical protein